MQIKGGPRTAKKKRTGGATVSQDGYITVGNVKVVRAMGGQVFVFDKNRHRSSANGGNQISIPVEEFIAAVRRAAAKQMAVDSD